MNVLAVCAGACGIELGLRLASEVCGFETRTVCYVEREAFAAANLVAKIEAGLLDDAPIWSELAIFRGGRWRGRVDCITAGIPCQPYSTAGKKRGDEDERAIWPEFVRVISDVKPALAFLEEVPEFVGDGYFLPVATALSGMGYKVEEPLSIGAFDLEAPHIRIRAFILAHTSGFRLAQPKLQEASCRTGHDEAAAQPLLLDTWPPGPGEVASIPRVADGMADRVDRLRLSGNGVVPVVAAYAFITLAREAGVLKGGI